MRRHTVALIAILGMVVLAGCSGGATTTVKPVDGEQAQSDTLAAMEAVESYHVTSNTTVVQSVTNQTRRQTIDSVGAFDRTNQRMQINRTVSVSGMSQQASVYLLNGSIYEYNPAYTSQYGSEWVTTEVGDAFFEQQDTLTRQRGFLANASVTTNGTETVNGTEMRVLEADVDEAATSQVIMARLGGASGVEYNVTNVDQRLWVDPETDRPARSTVSMNATVTQMGQTVDLTMDLELAFAYDRDVSVTLPEEADSAVSLDNETSS
ncbi:DUF7537 family lipoprotein [Halorhabdus rudnickae]|uniref:DUF7537 family lipoprotein n=1 Tax=Halorhabdus rudnickae TaxID=1775544 RepID=UPI0010826C29|nr:hypothetical protein [Halorhabdus rudnickae]